MTTGLKGGGCHQNVPVVVEIVTLASLSQESIAACGFSICIAHACVNLNGITKFVSSTISSACAFFADMSSVSGVRTSSMRHNREHNPMLSMPSESLPKPERAPVSGHRSQELLERRRAQAQQPDSVAYHAAFGLDLPAKRKHEGPFMDATKKKEQSERFAHMQRHQAKNEGATGVNPRAVSSPLNGVEVNLTPKHSSTNGLFAVSKTTQLANAANAKNGDKSWQSQIPRDAPATKRSFSQATSASASSPVFQKPKISVAPNPALTRSTLLTTNAHLHPAATEQPAPFSEAGRSARDGGAAARPRPPPISSTSFYSQSNTQNSRASIGVSADVVRAQPSQPPIADWSSARSTRSQTKLTTASTPSASDQSVVIIDSDDDGVDLQSPKYKSPVTNSGMLCCFLWYCFTFKQFDFLIRYSRAAQTSNILPQKRKKSAIAASRCMSRRYSSRHMSRHTHAHILDIAARAFQPCLHPPGSANQPFPPLHSHLKKPGTRNGALLTPSKTAGIIKLQVCI